MVALVLAALLQGPAPSGSAQSARAVVAPSPTPEAVAADTGVLRHAAGRTPPIARAVRVAAPPRVDGRLDDAVWADAAPITALYQNLPAEGQPASERTEVRILYDDDAIYVGARLYDAEPALIRSQLGRRDNTGSSDLFTIAFDSYHDHRTSFQFTVNPSGVRADGITNGDNAFGDGSWDPVWEARTQRDSLGWTAELRIPLSQLRFPPGRTQVWGVNVSRYIQRRAEQSEWAWKAQTDRGYASFFGHLFGIADLPQPRRLEALPYATARSEFGPATAGDPFHDGSRSVRAAGLDLKYGLTSNITVDATVNPDFGQVDQDPAFVNLSAFEQFLQERRPFFVEGADIFRFGGQQFFYSRRIGSPPRGSPNRRGGFADVPSNSTILGATKISGRTGRGWSVGFLDALTAREFATVDSAGVRFRDEVEPLTNYAVGRVKRDLRGGSTQVGGMFTAVHRDLSDARLAFLRSAAYSGGVDFTHRFGRNRWSLTGTLAGSHIRGDTVAIQRAQRSSARYFQRPDADYVDYDPARTTLAGWAGSLAFSRIQGKWTWGVSTSVVSPGFEINDAGFQTGADRVGVSANLNARWTRPGRVFRQANAGLNISGGWDFGGSRTSTFAGVFAWGQFRNYWSLNGNLSTNLRAASNNLTRGGPQGVSPAGGEMFLGVNSDFRKPVQFFLGADVFRNEAGANFGGVFSSLSLRPTTSVSVDIGPNLTRSRTTQLFLLSQADPTATATFGGQYVFGEIEQRSLDITTRLNMTFSPTLSLQLYAQPFLATGTYENFKELAAPRTLDYIVYGRTPGSTLQTTTNPDGSIAYHVGDPDGPGPRPAVTIGNPNFDVRSLRGNAVLRWEYRPGSTLFFVWTQNCGTFSQTPRFAPAGNLGQLCRGKGSNVFAVKLNWWMSV